MDHCRHSLKHTGLALCEKKPVEKKPATRNESEIKKKIEPTKTIQEKRKSMIPKLIVDRNESKIGQSSLPSNLSKISCFSDNIKDDSNRKLKIIEAKEKMIANYYNKIQELYKTVINEQDKPNFLKVKTLNSARKMISDTTVLKKENSALNKVQLKKKSFLPQISDITLKVPKTASKASGTSKNKANRQAETENASSKVSLKHTKSLTLVKTRKALNEAKKLMEHKEEIRCQIEKILNSNKAKSRKETRNQRHWEENEKSEEVKFLQENSTSNTDFNEEADVSQSKNFSEDKVKKHEEFEKITPSSNYCVSNEVSTFAVELTKKNTKISNLNNKIFELQKACNDHSIRYHQLYMKLLEYNEKVQWNEVLWKQIGKLKDKIKEVQKNNENLEKEKHELENKIKALKVEIVLKQKKYLVSSTGVISSSINNGGYGENIFYGRNENVIEIENNSLGHDISTNKEILIEHLKSMLALMKDQENAAHNQIKLFQNKIKELESRSLI